MSIRSLLLLNTRKTCPNSFLYQIRYTNNLAENNNVAKDNKNNKPSFFSRILKKYPNLDNAYNIVVGGFQEVFKDGRRFIELLRKATSNEKGLANLNLEELLFYRQFTRNLAKLVPIVLLGILPFGNAVIIPLVLYYPRHLVTPHFWTEKQKSTIPEEEFQDRLKHHEPLLNLFTHVPSSEIPDSIFTEWRSFLLKLQKGMYPEPSEVLIFEKLFDCNSIFHLSNLSTVHTIHLAGIYGLPKLFFPSNKLVRFCHTNLIIDSKIRENGGPEKLPSDIRSQICFMRGVNSMKMTEKEKILYLQKWLIVNQHMSLRKQSLLLHTPILLGYNH